jgi:hypothetical protein
MEQAEGLGRRERQRGGSLPAAGITLAVIAVVLIPVSRLAAGTADTDALALAGACLVAVVLLAAPVAGPTPLF